MCRMKRSSGALELAKSSLMNRRDAATRALADHGYAAPSTQTASHRHASLPAGIMPSTWVPPVVPVCAGPPAKPRRRDSITSKIAEIDVSSGD